MDNLTKEIIRAIKALESTSGTIRYKEIEEHRIDAGPHTMACSYDGFDIYLEPYCYVVWKHTSLDEQPQWKGDDVSKAIPVGVTDEKRIKTILENQDWLYW